MRELEGQVAVVTGGSRGIGRAIACELGRAGASVAVIARSEDRARETLALLEGPGVALACDVADPGQCSEVAAAVQDELGAIDLLVNNAGGTLPGPALQCTDDELDKAFHFNVTTAFHMSRALAPSMAVPYASIPAL